ncbi:trk system potassium uptake protein TrkA [Plasticicumulans lactativorans]|uniref:Trk system potassium uptake protein TrkA n=1 Tax=Plasticicumulans lactativorans TaxID=1133106 RepID=A0A4R2L4E5_9GAMM|nr:Trk system potassium transporter TrkA [Plasticicumulans lactativorans]TCO81464.1 trk system potassium uptake protein TrkA [Plasticicumulans lactativorans]
MKILILGAGQVGASVAYNLAGETGNDITLVDTRADVLADLQDRIDIRTVCGHAAHPGVLAAAGAADADLLIALTSSDEVNMIACLIADRLHRTPKKIARVRGADYASAEGLFSTNGGKDGGLPIDVRIAPEQLVTEHVQRLIENPGALQVLDFAEGLVRLVGVRAYHGGNLVGHALLDLPRHMPGIDARVAAIFRQGNPIIPEGDTVIEVDDEVFFVTAKRNIRAVMAELRKLDKPVKRVMLAGGGNIGRRLAKALEERFQVKLIERNPDCARRIAEELGRTIVLLGDAADEELLLEENIEHTDVFCAVTNDDEANILSAMLAKRLGARKVMALINRPAYVDLVEASGTVDVAISPQQTTISGLLAYIRRGDVARVHSLRRGAAEAIEAVAHGDRNTSKVVGRCVEEIRLPPGTTIGAVVRDNEVIIAHHDTLIQAEDHVILFLVDKRRVKDVENLFRVSATFL